MRSLSVVIFFILWFFFPRVGPTFRECDSFCVWHCCTDYSDYDITGGGGGGVVGLWVLMWHDATDCGLSCDKRLTLFWIPLYTTMFASLAVKCSAHRNRESAAIRRTAVSRITIMMTFCDCVADNLSFQLVDRDIN